ncbi:MAG: hypothetical protein AVO35_12990 [Candidatus Aegiribacteria sp. MLS_C]|nr:MAG: hypothetical protein AVO35_12990 [Candidatus Aegiribacteria sp. MLS_C]
MGREFPPDLLEDIKRLVQIEIANGANRVKQATDEATLHPVIEGAVHVMKSIALDMCSVLTVSVHDPDSSNDLFYSVPCTIGNQGILERLDNLIPADTKDSMRLGIENAIRFLHSCGDA